MVSETWFNDADISDTSPAAITARAQHILAGLVGYDSRSSRTNKPVIDAIAAYLARLDIWHRVYDAGQGKYGLWAHIGPEQAGGVVLSGHSDVVPVDGQNWSQDPFTLTERGGRLYGRGTCDMKGFLAIVLASVPYFRSLDLKTPVQIAISWDEEIGCLGAPPLIAMAGKDFPKAEMAIIGEPSNMHVVTAQKGIMGFETTVNGFEMHSSQVHRSVPAVMVAAELIEWHRREMFTNAENAVPSPFDPPYTTLHVGKIEGGIAANITAKYCRFLSDIRTLPEDDAGAWSMRYQDHLRQIEARIQGRQPSTSIDFVETSRTPGLRPVEGNPAEMLARQITGDNATHVVAYGTEAGQFQEAGYASIICGPGSIDQAHQADEYLELSQLGQAVTFMENLGSKLAT